MLMRHAKSDWGADFDRDLDRPLNRRGERSARLMGTVLAGKGQIPDLVISSPAVRALTTVELAKEAGSWDTPITIDQRLYGGGTAGVLEVASHAPDVERLMLVGHEPTWSTVVSLLTGAAAEMKTAVVAVVDLEIERWAGVDTGVGKLVELHRPRDY